MRNTQVEKWVKWKQWGKETEEGGGMGTGGTASVERRHMSGARVHLGDNMRDDSLMLRGKG